MEYTAFDNLRRELLLEALSFKKKEDINNEFKRKFLSLIEKCTLSLIEGEDNFFGLFMIQIKREISINLSWPIETRGSLNNYIMTFSVKEFLNLTKGEMCALIKHEIFHIMYNHYSRIKVLRNEYSPLVVNLAMDVSVNQFIKGLPGFCHRIDSINMSINADLKEDESLETYAYKIQKALDEIEKDSKSTPLSEDFNMEKVHDSWLNKDFDSKELSKKNALNAYKGDNAPKGLELLLKALRERPEIKWSSYLKRIIRTEKGGYKKTITRKDRRQPDRLDLRGSLRDHIGKILIAIDISGSISDEEIKEILREVFGIVKNKTAEITVAEVDDKVRRTYKVKGKKDLKPKLDRRGGTAFSPLFNYSNKNGFKDHLIVYFTDGMGEEELSVKPLNKNILWVLTGKGKELSLKKSYGKVLKLKESNDTIYENKNVTGIRVAKDMLKDINTREWIC